MIFKVFPGGLDWAGGQIQMISSMRKASEKPNWRHSPTAPTSPTPQAAVRRRRARPMPTMKAKPVMAISSAEGSGTAAAGPLTSNVQS